MSAAKFLVLLLTSGLLAGCGTYATSSVTPTPGAAPQSQSTAAPAAQAAPAARAPEQVIVSENDMADRRYTSLGDISVTVRKWTLFDADPTRERVARALQEKAAEMGADAVIFVRYGTVGIGLFSWGQMDGQGRAVRFQ